MVDRMSEQRKSEHNFVVVASRLPVDRAADVLRIPPGTVKSRCARGRARLAVLLDQLRPGSPAGGNGSAAGRVPSKNGDTSQVAGGGRHD